MHIVLGLLGTIVTILILLNRLAEAGIDLWGLNPFLWNRRRKWRKKYDGNPAFKLSDPMDATALLMVAIAKYDGDMTREQKAHILGLFEREFRLSRKDAEGLLIASVHLYGDGQEVKSKIREVIAPSAENFTQDQARSATGLVRAVADAESEPNPGRDKMVALMEKELARKFQSTPEWGSSGA